MSLAHGGGREISASEFKARCLGLLDEVARSGEAIVITKRGRPVARLEPLIEPPSLTGSVTFRTPDDELIAPIASDWEAQSG
ncbi:MAG: type II toxin-antitoxin system Phd/YefM family antitoxin [Solirubrobacteraceae bacterium]